MTTTDEQLSMPAPPWHSPLLMQTNKAGYSEGLCTLVALKQIMTCYGVSQIELSKVQIQNFDTREITIVPTEEGAVIRRGPGS